MTMTPARQTEVQAFAWLSVVALSFFFLQLTTDASATTTVVAANSTRSQPIVSSKSLSATSSKNDSPVVAKASSATAEDSIYVPIPIAAPVDVGLGESVASASANIEQQRQSSVFEDDDVSQNDAGDDFQPATKTNGGATKSVERWTGSWPKKFQIGYIKQSDLHQVLVESLKADPFSVINAQNGGREERNQNQHQQQVAAGASSYNNRQASTSEVKTAIGGQTKSKRDNLVPQLVSGLRLPNLAPNTRGNISPLYGNEQKGGVKAQQQPSFGGFRPQQFEQQKQQMIIPSLSLPGKQLMTPFVMTTFGAHQHSQQPHSFQRQLGNPFNRPNHNLFANHNMNQLPAHHLPRSHHSSLQRLLANNQNQNRHNALRMQHEAFKNQPVYTFNSFQQQEQSDLNSMHLNLMMNQPQQQQQANAYSGNSNNLGWPQQTTSSLLLSTSQPVKPGGQLSPWRPVEASKDELASEIMQQQRQEKSSANSNKQQPQEQQESNSLTSDDFDEGFGTAKSVAPQTSGLTNMHPMINKHLNATSGRQLSPAKTLKLSPTASSSASGAKGATTATKSTKVPASGQSESGASVKTSVGSSARRLNDIAPTKTGQSPATATQQREEPIVQTQMDSRKTAGGSVGQNEPSATTTVLPDTSEPDSESVDSSSDSEDAGRITSTTVASLSGEAPPTTAAPSVTASATASSTPTTTIAPFASSSSATGEADSAEGTTNNPSDDSEVATDAAFASATPSTDAPSSNEQATVTTSSPATATATTTTTTTGSLSSDTATAAVVAGAKVEREVERVDNTRNNKKATRSSERLTKVSPISQTKMLISLPSAAGAIVPATTSASTSTSTSTSTAAVASAGKNKAARLVGSAKKAERAQKGAKPKSRKSKSAARLSSTLPATARGKLKGGSSRAAQIVSMTPAQAQSTAQTLASLLLARCMSSANCANLLDVCATRQANVALLSELTAASGGISGARNGSSTSAPQSAPARNTNWSMPVGLASGSIMSLTSALNADAAIKMFAQWKDAIDNTLDFNAQFGYTLILPSNDAIARLPQATVDSWLQNSDLLEQVVQSHILDSVETIDLPNMSTADNNSSNNSGTSQQLETPQASAAIRATGVSRSKLLRAEGLHINQHRDSTVTINGKRVVYANQAAPSGGRIHVIDGVLESPLAQLWAPNSKPLDIMDTLKQCDKFDGFVTLAEGTGLNQLLKQDGPMTVFVPSNEALMKIPDNELDVIKSNSTALKEFLLYHVVNGSYFSQDLRDGQQLSSMLNKKPIQVGIRVDGCSRRLVEANTSPMRRPDIATKNGVIHILDWYLSVRDEEWCEPNAIATSARLLQSPPRQSSSQADASANSTVDVQLQPQLQAQPQSQSQQQQQSKSFGQNNDLPDDIMRRSGASVPEVASV